MVCGQMVVGLFAERKITPKFDKKTCYWKMTRYFFQCKILSFSTIATALKSINRGEDRRKNMWKKQHNSMVFLQVTKWLANFHLYPGIFHDTDEQKSE
jgi:hypothetical protein